MDNGVLKELPNGNSQEGFTSSGKVVHYLRNSALSIVFENQARQFPNNLAIIFEDKKISYAELDSASNWIANLISDKIQEKRRPDAIVALCLERNDIMVTTILAILKSGIAYVALDSKYPSERIKFILEDTTAVLMITDNANYDFIKSYMEEERILNLNSVGLLPNSYVAPPDSIGTTDEHLSHILYTSGTTGKPKAVMVTREALITDCLDYRIRYGIGPGDQEVVVHFLNYVFNAAKVPFLTALSNGYPLLVVRPSLLYETDKFYEYLAGHGVTHIDGTPSLVARLDLARIPALKRIAIGGEPLTSEVFNQFKASAPNVSVFNIFGNSEGTLCVMYENVAHAGGARILKTVTVNKRCYLLSPTNEHVRIGEVGELGISGRGLARGYLNNPKITNERFIPNPFQTENDKLEGTHGILYKTGDLFRFQPSGHIESIGRQDHQIKIRGYRVELEEIESVIRSSPNVSQCVVVANNTEKSDQATLMAFYVPADGVAGEGQEAILAHIQKTLPDYMIPSRIITLKEMPLTLNGKIDRNALPIPPPTYLKNSNSAGTNGHSSPDDPILVTLTAIWKEILNLPSTEDYGTENDFFETGGNSLLAMRLVERVNAELGISIDAAHVFRFSTIDEFRQNLPI